MSLRYKIFIAIMFSVCVSAILAAAPLFLGSRQMAQEGAERELLQMQARVQGAMDSRVQNALSMARVVAAMPRVKRAVSKGDGKGLKRLFVKNFSEFSEDANIRQFHFHSPDNTSILRVHDPDTSGDDLSATRPMVVQANATTRAIAGLESGPNGVGIRGIAPVGDDDDHFGTVEFGLAFDEAFLTEAIGDSATILEVYFLDQSNDGDAASVVSDTNRIAANFDGPPLLDAITVDHVLANEASYHEIKIEDQPYGAIGFLITDFQENPIAVGHIIVSQSGFQAISQNVMTRTVFGALAAVLISAILAWVFGRNLTHKLKQVISRMQRLTKGETKISLSDISQEKAEIGELVQHLTVFRDGLVEAEQLRDERARIQAAQDAVVDSLGSGLAKVAKGNLDATIEGDFDAEYQPLIANYNMAVHRLTDVISAITDTAISVSDSANWISQSAEDLSDRTEESAATLEETASSLEQITSAINNSNDGARKADASGNDAIQKARAGADVVASTVQAMNDIDNSANEIARISEMIDDIAFQTNLLALNAGVEAARAGDAGSGFAVVAAEVRSLAQRTTEAARQISSLIATSGNRVQHGVSLVGETGKALDDIFTAISSVTEQIRRIAELSGEQAQGLAEINASIGHLDQATQENAGMFERTTTASQALQKEGRQLSDLVGQFRLPNAKETERGATPKAA